MSWSRRVRGAIAASAIAAGLTVPVAAEATTVTRSTLEQGPAIQVIDNAGVPDNLEAVEPNTSVRVRSQSFVATQPGPPITAGFGCSQLTPTLVECPGAPLLIAALGGGDDVFT